MSDDLPQSSRYRNAPVRMSKGPDGSMTPCLGRRIIPETARYRALDRHRVGVGERIDTIAAYAYGDSELYWRICDANGDQDPAAASEVTGRLLVIPLPLEVADDGQS